jgi:hypothetical protein
MADVLFAADPTYLYTWLPVVTTNVETIQLYSPIESSFSVPVPLIETGEYTQYYTDIDTSYDATSGTGTSASPFNYLQMKSRITSGGAGEYHDSYNLRGYRTLQSLSVNYENWFLKTDPSKNFMFQAWNLSAYGPWILSCYCNNIIPEYNPKVSFAGATLMNGIIYNVPWVGVGHEIEISITYDMLINSIGTGGGIKFYPTQGKYEDYTGFISFDNDCYLIGSTIYPENGITDDYQTNYNINAIDTVCKNFLIKSDETCGHFSGCTLNMYNSGFDVMPQINRINIYDDFDGGIINAFWNSAFSADYALTTYPPSGTNYAASAATPNILDKLTPYKFDGDFNLEYGIITSDTNYSAAGKGIGLTMLFDNGGNDYFGIDELLNTSIKNSVVYKSTDDAFSVVKAFTFSAYKEIKFKLIRQGHNLSAYTDIGSGWEFITSREATDSIFSILDLYVTSENNYGFSYFNFISMAFVSGADIQNQWNEAIIFPDPYLFTPGHPNYLKNLTYVNANKEQLKPFAGITSPPNPGRNHPTYPAYTTGLFGYSRKDYVPNF